ncbi:MAG: hypothetical protein WDO56_09375 [Gammaproteobacteria bacterium]
MNPLRAILMTCAVIWLSPCMAAGQPGKALDYEPVAGTAAPLAAANPAPGAAESVVAGSQRWVKRGVILRPGFAGPQSAKLVSSPSVVKLKNGRLRMYFWAADGVPPWHGRHIILAAEADPANPFVWNLVSSRPMVGADPSGNIRDRGVGFPYVLARDDGPWLMYYGTWGSWAPADEVSNRTGLAASDDQGLTWRVIQETVLPLGKPGSYDAGLTGSVSVLRESDGLYRMWYTAGERYVRFGERNRGIVHVGAATSTDGIHWTKAARPAIAARLDTVDPYEAVLGKPNVVKIDGVYHFWVSVYCMPPGAKPSRGESYRSDSDADRSHWQQITRQELGYHIEYARSVDGVTWQRQAGQPVMTLTPGEFDSKNQSYPMVIDMGTQLWMFYVGNEFGSTGIGLATLDKSELR